GCLPALLFHTVSAVNAQTRLNYHKNGNCSAPSQLQPKIHAKSPLAMELLLGRGTLSYGQRSECADLLNSYQKCTFSVIP
ncbi:hypothetical protein, partial [Blautia marasmi]|uniref:hypothetical protein n=1 Tax=Blautia marasmi TaxID=1917868 RepID=UPI00266C0C51